jgi:hypothetical protein
VEKRFCQVVTFSGEALARLEIKSRLGIGTAQNEIQSKSADQADLYMAVLQPR